VGDYRVILDIHREGLVIIAVDVGNRSSIYD
jgi:mRNA interferase RelE/StbE